METVMSTRPLWAVLAGTLAIPLIIAAGERRPNLRETWTLLAAFAKAGIVLSMLPAVLAGNALSISLWEITPGVELALRVDTLGFVFGMVASTLWVLTSIYSIGYVRGGKYAGITFMLLAYPASRAEWKKESMTDDA